MSPPGLVIFDFDGTLFDTHQAIAHSITRAFQTLLPEHSPANAEVQRLIGSGMGLQDALNTLHPTPGSFNEEDWTSTYRRIYNDEGQQLVKPFDGAQKLLDLLQTRKVPMAIVSNKGVAAVMTALQNHDLGGYIPEALIVGDKTPGATRKPDVGSYTNVLVPALRKIGSISNIEELNVLVVGDTEADLRFASNINGAKSVWCRYGYGSQEGCEKLQPDFTIDSLAQIEQLLDSF